MCGNVLQGGILSCWQSCSVNTDKRTQEVESHKELGQLESVSKICLCLSACCVYVSLIKLSLVHWNGCLIVTLLSPYKGGDYVPLLFSSPLPILASSHCECDQFNLGKSAKFWRPKPADTFLYLTCVSWLSHCLVRWHCTSRVQTVNKIEVPKVWLSLKSSSESLHSG